jgi:hypothetical protein
MNNISIIIRILFAVTTFQHPPLKTRVFFSSIMREREDNIINNIKWEDNIINIILASVSINHQNFSSSTTSSFLKECHHHLHQYVLVKTDTSSSSPHKAGSSQYKIGFTSQLSSQKISTCLISSSCFTSQHSRWKQDTCPALCHNHQVEA